MGDAMDMMMTVAAVMAFAPTLLLMYGILKKYTYPAVEQPFFKDATFFFMFALALIFGTVMFACYTFLWSSIIPVMLFAVVEILVFAAVFNLKRFSMKSDAVFYGYGFGLGVGCTFAFGFIFFIGRNALNMGASLDILSYVMLFLYGMGFLMEFSAVGTTVAEGVARHRLGEYIMQAMITNFAFMMVVTASFMTSSEALMWACLVFSLVVSGGHFYHTLVKGLSAIVREVLRAEGNKRKVP